MIQQQRTRLGTTETNQPEGSATTKNKRERGRMEPGGTAPVDDMQGNEVKLRREVL
jgi:hypothetical protein